MKDKVIDAIREALTLREDQIQPNTHISEIARDSMDVVEIISVLSYTFGIAVIPKELDKIKNINDIVLYVEKHQKNPS